MNNRNNLFNPYNFNNPGMTKPGFDWSNFLNNTQKTIGIINQSIPIFYQLKPIWNNTKTVFKVFNEVNKINKSEKNSDSPAQDTRTNETSNNPVFFN